MVAVGGGRGFTAADAAYAVYPDGRNRQVELYDASTSSWKLGPPEQEDRAYHSTAVLLPDGRVFSAGDDFHPTNADGSASTTDTAEIYSPPYLFKGARPVIDSAPTELRWDDDFGIASASPGLTAAVLVAPGATTHGADMNQRVVPLDLIENLGGTGMNAVSPPSPEVAPPGYYMLFLLDTQGIPSVARWVRLDAGAPDQPRISPGANSPASTQAGATRSSQCASMRRKLRKAHSRKAKRRLRRKLRALGC
jgi:hypothetical protein